MVDSHIETVFTFYRPMKPEHNWYGMRMPCAPVRGQSIHPGDVLGEEFDRCWDVLHVRWVFDGGRWVLEVGLT